MHTKQFSINYSICNNLDEILRQRICDSFALIGRFSPSYAENSMPAHAGTYGLFEGVASMSQALT
jgi:hypothetical protein